MLFEQSPFVTPSISSSPFFLSPPPTFLSLCEFVLTAFLLGTCGQTQIKTNKQIQKQTNKKTKIKSIDTYIHICTDKLLSHCWIGNRLASQQ